MPRATPPHPRRRDRRPRLARRSPPPLRLLRPHSPAPRLAPAPAPRRRRLAAASDPHPPRRAAAPPPRGPRNPTLSRVPPPTLFNFAPAISTNPFQLFRWVTADRPQTQPPSPPAPIQRPPLPLIRWQTLWAPGRRQGGGRGRFCWYEATTTQGGRGLRRRLLPLHLTVRPPGVPLPGRPDAGSRAGPSAFFTRKGARWGAALPRTGSWPGGPGFRRRRWTRWSAPSAHPA